MTPIVDWTISVVGFLAVALVLRDIFHTLGHPGLQGRLSRVVLSAAWRMSRGRRAAAWAGPLAMLAVIGSWGVLAVTGWALIYLPHLPGGFTFAGGGGAGLADRALDALYISLVTISTLGLGDVVPVSGWLRIVNPIEALFGFALLTVAVSWVLQVYPALARRRELALWISLLEQSDAIDELPDLGGSAGAALLERIATGVVGVRVDLSEYAETYYFREDDRESSLAAQLAYAADLAEAGAGSPHPEVRFAARVLHAALDDLASVIDDRFLHLGAPRSVVIEAYAADHRHL